MTSLKAFAAASCLGLLTFVPSATADQWNKKTIITVGEPIQVPGQVLQPGKYVMKLMDSPANRHIVQVFNEDETQLLTTVLAIPNYRLEVTGETQFGFWETPAGQPKALRAWFYPGDNFGQEFAYPKDQAVTIAQQTGQNVPTTYAESEADLATARVGAIDKAGTEMELDRETYNRPQEAEVAQNEPQEGAPAQQQEVAPAPVEEPAETQIAQAQTPQREVEPMETDRPTALPRTASPLPMFGMAGLLALGAGMAVRAVASRN
jgi:hypothetical protein